MSDTTSGLLTIAALVALLAAAYVPLGDHMARVYTSTRHLRVERAVYRLSGVDPDAEQGAGREEPDLVVEVGDLRLDVTDSRATRGGDEVHLTPTEWRIVEVLARRRGRPVRQVELLTAVWGPAYDTQTNYLRVHLASIRRKLETDPASPVLFVTEPGMGYRFAP